MGVTHASADDYILRFSDTRTQPSIMSHPHHLQFLNASKGKPDIAPKQAESWLKQHGWKQVWPKWFVGDDAQPLFAGPSTQRYLRLAADDTYYIWSRRLELDPNQRRYLNITWSVERFPNQAALDVLGRNDRPIVVMVSFGDKVRSPGLRPNVPRALAFFWDESATVGASYTCVKPKIGNPDARMQCTYPHIKYIALRRSNPGTVHTDRVDLVTLFRHHFADYWREKQQVPPIVAVSFEARSDRTSSHSSARLYELAFSEKPHPKLAVRSLSADPQSSFVTQ
jgi:hypothetical protein